MHYEERESRRYDYPSLFVVCLAIVSLILIATFRLLSQRLVFFRGRCLLTLRNHYYTTVISDWWLFTVGYLKNVFLLELPNSFPTYVTKKTKIRHSSLEKQWMTVCKNHFFNIVDSQNKSLSVSTWRKASIITWKHIRKQTNWQTVYLWLSSFPVGTLRDQSKEFIWVGGYQVRWCALYRRVMCTLLLHHSNWLPGRPQQ